MINAVVTACTAGFFALLFGCGFSGAGGDANSGSSRVIDAQVTLADGKRDQIDAGAVIDAKPPFSVAMCPSNYQDLAFLSGSRYRGGAAGQKRTWSQAAVACANDAPGLTHLMVADKLEELAGVASAIQPDHNREPSWLGHFTVARGMQLVDVAVVDSNFTMPSSTAANSSRDSTTAYFADDSSPIPELGSTRRNSKLNYICECDGKPPVNLPTP